MGCRLGVPRSHHDVGHPPTLVTPKPTAYYVRNGYIGHGHIMPPTNDPQEQLPLTPVVLHILLALADEPQGKHGYAVAREVEELTNGQIRMGPGTLYGSIQRMLDASLIEQRTARASADERRRYYRLTAFGRRVLSLELARLAEVVAVARRKQLLPA
jgi:DNA-binding PadR family transcriptional regulator